MICHSLYEMLALCITENGLKLRQWQLDAHLLYYTIRPLQSPTCFKNYMLIIRRLIALMQHLVSSSRSVAVQCTGWERTWSYKFFSTRWLHYSYAILFYVLITIYLFCLFCIANFCILLIVHLSISLENDQLDAHLLYFAISPLNSSTCFKH